MSFTSRGQACPKGSKDRWVWSGRGGFEAGGCFGEYFGGHIDSFFRRYLAFVNGVKGTNFWEENFYQWLQIST